jgi:hypothetical protein
LTVSSPGTPFCCRSTWLSSVGTVYAVRTKDGVLYTHVSIRSTTHCKTTTAAHTLDALAKDWTAPGRLAKQRNIMMSVCGIRKLRMRQSSPCRFPKLIFFPGARHRANTASQSRRAASQTSLCSQTRKRLQHVSPTRLLATA